MQRAFDLLGAKAQELAKITEVSLVLAGNRIHACHFCKGKLIDLDPLGFVSQDQTAELNASFEEPLKEFCKYIKCVKGVMSGRIPW